MMIWKLFKKYHYLSNEFNKAARSFIIKLQNKLIGFNSILSMPSGTLKNAWREHRLVILPDFQGMGIGNSFSEAIGEILKKENKYFYSKTANKKLGEYRNSSPYWKATSTNGKNRLNMDDSSLLTAKMVNPYLRHRFCYSHKYIGKN